MRWSEFDFQANVYKSGITKPKGLDQCQNYCSKICNTIPFGKLSHQKQEESCLIRNKRKVGCVTSICFGYRTAEEC